MSIQKDGIRLHKSNFSAIGQQIQPMLESGDCYRLILKPWRDKRSIPQNSLMWMWNSDVATAVNQHSTEKLNEEDLHEFLTVSYTHLDVYKRQSSRRVRC